MRARLLAASIAAALSLTFAAAASAASVRPTPSWFTPEFAAQVHAAGAKGKHVPAETLNLECPGYQLKSCVISKCPNSMLIANLP